MLKHQANNTSEKQYFTDALQKIEQHSGYEPEGILLDDYGYRHYFINELIKEDIFNSGYATHEAFKKAFEDDFDSDSISYDYYSKDPDLDYLLSLNCHLYIHKLVYPSTNSQMLIALLKFITNDIRENLRNL